MKPPSIEADLAAFAELQSKLGRRATVETASDVVDQLSERSAGAVIVLEVLGTPAPKGSGRAMLIGGKARYIASSSGANARKQARWSDAVRQCALAQPDGFKETPLAVTIEFRMPRLASHLSKRTGVAKPGAPRAPTTYPDVDKLTRCTLDALVTRKYKGKVHYGIIDDDSRIVRLEVTKLYADPGREGARITVEEWKAA